MSSRRDEGSRLSSSQFVSCTWEEYLFGGPFVKWFVLCYRSVVCLSVLSCPVCLSVTLVYCGQTVGWIKMKLGVKIGLSPGQIVFDGTQLPLRKGAQPPQFSVHVCCGQTASWIKVPLGTAVGLSPGDTVIDGDHAPLPKRWQNTNFQLTYIVAKRLDGSICHLVYGGRPQPRPHCVRPTWGPSPPPTRTQGAYPSIFGRCLLWSNGRPSQLLLSTC